MLGSFVALVTGASLTVLSEPIHRGSLANARRALEEHLATEASVSESSRLAWRGNVRQAGAP